VGAVVRLPCVAVDRQSQTVEELRRIQLLASLSDEALARLAQVALRREFGPGEAIILEGMDCEAAYFLLEGRARVSRSSPGGREQVLARLGPGQAFNTVPPFCDRGTNHATVVALTPVVLYALPRAAMLRLVTEIPELALAFLRDFAARLDHLSDLVEDLSLRSVRGRLARFLLEHADEGALDRGWTQDEIAAQIGTVRDVVGRTLRAFADAGLIRIDRQRIVLLQRQALEEEAFA